MQLDNTKKHKLFASICIVIFVLMDQLIKVVVESNMQLSESIPVINNVLHITYVLNDGAAFSFMSGNSWLLSGLTSVIMGILIYVFYSKMAVHPLAIWSISLLIGGGIGNLIDRFFRGDILFHGKVVDYVDFRIINFAVFNFADCCVVIGTILISVYLIFFEKTQKVLTEENDNE